MKTEGSQGSGKIVDRGFKTFGDFYEWCLSSCPMKRVGCARGCDFRRRLRLPPHGPRYPPDDTSIPGDQGG